MNTAFAIRAVRPEDFRAWLLLFDGYNAFYGRSGDTRLPDAIVQTTWSRFFDFYEPMHAFVAERDGALIGLVHFLYHRSTTHLGPLCYLQDLFTAPTVRGQGVARGLIHAVYEHARNARSSRVYWMTHETNSVAMKLYDQIADKPGFLIYRKSLPL